MMLTILTLLMAQPQGGQPQGQGSMMSTLFMFLLIFVVMYFFMIRPQSKKAKEQKEFRDTLEKGRKVVTIGGIHGKIVDLGDTTCTIEVEGQNKLKIEKSAISQEFTNAAYGKAEEKKS